MTMNVSLQQTRRHILDILREKGSATVDEIVELLQDRRGKEITPVTVRHHLHLLQQEELIVSPVLRRKSSPGRPQHVYALTDKGKEHFPTNYENLAANLLTQIESRLPRHEVNVILEGVVSDTVATLQVSGLSLDERLKIALEHLNQQGYNAHIESSEAGFVLYTRNCPYHHLAQSSHSLCDMDMRLITQLTGVVPRLLSRMSAGDAVCSYLLPTRASRA